MNQEYLDELRKAIKEIQKYGIDKDIIKTLNSFLITERFFGKNKMLALAMNYAKVRYQKALDPCPIALLDFKDSIIMFDLSWFFKKRSRKRKFRLIPVLAILAKELKSAKVLISLSSWLSLDGKDPLRDENRRTTLVVARYRKKELVPSIELFSVKRSLKTEDVLLIKDPIIGKVTTWLNLSPFKIIEVSDEGKKETPEFMSSLVKRGVKSMISDDGEVI